MRYLIAVLGRVLVVRVHTGCDPPMVLLVAHVTTDRASHSRRVLVGSRSVLGVSRATSMLSTLMVNGLMRANGTRRGRVLRQVVLNHGRTGRI